MYKKILIPLDNSKTDSAILQHIQPLAKLTGAGLVLIHVADGYAARLQNELNLEDSEEIKKDREYLQECQEKLTKAGFKVEMFLESGDPADRILAVAEKEKCDLIAMATHGHRLIQDVVLGSVANKIRHHTDIPVLMIRASME